MGSIREGPDFFQRSQVQFTEAVGMAIEPLGRCRRSQSWGQHAQRGIFGVARSVRIVSTINATGRNSAQVEADQG